jgi:hypothetical protein
LRHARDTADANFEEILPLGTSCGADPESGDFFGQEAVTKW